MRGSILKREGVKGVSYRIKYESGRDAEGKRKYVYETFGTKKEAQAALSKLLNQVNEGTHIDPLKKTLAQWVEEFLLIYSKKVSLRTYEGYADLLRRHVVSRIGDLQLQKITTSHIDKIYMELLTSGRDLSNKLDKTTTGLSSRYVLHVHRALSLCLKTAHKKGLIAKNPVDTADAPNPNQSSTEESVGTEIHALSNEELQSLLVVFKGRALFPIVLTAAFTGMRRGELLALRWSDVNLDAGTMQIVRSVERTTAAGVRIKNSPKNKSSSRTITIDTSLATHLKQHWKELAETALKLGIRLSKDDLIFPSIIPARRGRPELNIKPTNDDIDFSRPRHPDYVTKEFSRVAKTCGFADLSFHDLRHTHATMLLDANVPVHAVAQRLGHSSPVTTMTVYAHVLKRAEGNAAEISGNLLRACLGE